MHIDDVEAAYFQKRIEISFALASAATDECVKMAHKSLAILYTSKLKALLLAMDPPVHRQDLNPSLHGNETRGLSKIHGTLRVRCPA